MAEEARRPDAAARAKPSGERRSASAADARRREAERIAAMTATERALLALDLGDRYAAWAAAIPVVDLPHLVALKLATGAFRDEVDVGDLLEARADLSIEELRTTCGRHGLGEALERVLGRIGRR